ncbi:MAG: alkaline phosphatase family protein [Bacteroidetes bacterium]|nr:alkaline phosphatase family protein [Bacteroidota bacterium]
MKDSRRSFIKKAGLLSAGAFVAPYILPSGRLFAATGIRRANHVVFCLFAGGVRNLETIQKAEGNLMPYTLSGTEAISSDILAGMSPLPAPIGNPLQLSGTLFKDFRYKSGPTGHFNGHTTAITGVYTDNDLDIKTNPQYPTVFEYYRKHNSPSQTALNAWWISNALGPYPALNFSKDSNYGALYGGNHIQPAAIIGSGYDALGHPKVFSSAQASAAKSMRSFLDNNFANQTKAADAGVTNGESDAVKIETFIQQSFVDAASGLYNNPWNLGASMNNDMYNIFFAEKIMQQFKPELMVVNMQDVDIAHSNFTEYCNNMRKADYALTHLWNTIQSTPGMANDTVLIVAPEHGRNLTHNSIVDNFGRYALDHTNDQTSREIFCLVLGPPGKVKTNTVFANPSGIGESIDIVPTIADVLGFYNDIPMSYRSRMGSPLTQAFI